MSEALTPQTFSILLSPQQSGELSPITDSRFVGAHDIKGCSVSTTVRDVRHGRYTDGISGESHAACAILLKFNFTNHLSKRIQKIKICLSFSASQPSPITSQSPINASVPELRLYEPSFGRSKATSLKITLDRCASASFGMDTGAKIGGDVSKTVEKEKSFSAWLSASQEATDTVSWYLSENAQEKQGIPSELNCAVVIRTDGVPFTASVKFTAGIRGTFGTFRGSKAAFVDEDYFLNRKSVMNVDDVGLLDDMGSEKFGDWIKSSANNSWIVQE
jgi:hypothetical protein